MEEEKLGARHRIAVNLPKPVDQPEGAPKPLWMEQTLPSAIKRPE